MPHRPASLIDNANQHARGWATPSRLRFCVALGAAMIAPGLFATSASATDPLPTVTAVDLGRYAGTSLVSLVASGLKPFPMRNPMSSVDRRVDIRTVWRVFRVVSSI